jgi:hypothetical protein
MSGSCSTHGRDENAYNVWLGNLNGRDHSDDIETDGRIILEWILGK